jgi:hypothetical protein
MDIPRNIKWILLAVALFAVGHYSLRSALNSFSLANPSYTQYMSWVNAAALALYFVCSLVSSYLNRKQFIFTGTVTGTLSAITAIVVFNVAVNDSIGMAITLVTGIVLGALGGFAAKLLTRRRAHAL